MTSIGWGTIQKSHNFDTISHRVDGNGRVGLEFLKKKVLTRVFTKAITVFPEMVSDDAQ